MSLFKNLLTLYPQPRPIEDFFTEIVAHFFQCNPTILLKWLHHHSNGSIEVSLQPSILTQCSYGALESHGMGSRPDMQIELTDDNGDQDIVLVESKLGSTEGADQLSRYADHLREFTKYRHRYLVYITRDYDPKDEKILPLGSGENAVHFIQIRWHQFYHFIGQFPKNALVEEIKNFMEAHHMAQRNHFSSINLISMMHFQQSIKLMESCLEGKVKERFDQVLTNATNYKKATNELRWHGRFIVAKCYTQNFWCYMGFVDMNDTQPTTYPNLRICFEVAPKSKDRKELVQWMKRVRTESNSPWEERNLDSPEEWASIHITENMQAFLSAEDHVAAVQNFFLESLEIVKKLKERSPELQARCGEIVNDSLAEKPKLQELSIAAV